MSSCKTGYQSPRWSAEVLDCSMPMTFDTYSACSYNCLYCFAFYQKSHCVNGYQSEKPRSVDPSCIARMFTNVLGGNLSKLTVAEKQFAPYIGSRKMLQWGAMADQFDDWEKQFGVTLLLLKFFDSIDYPLSFSTKSAWWTLDDRYMAIFARHKHNWHVKTSIITLDKAKARDLEAGVDSPMARIESLGRLAKLGINTTLRLRPYIIGASDDFKSTISEAARVGVKSVTTEFFCLEGRADQAAKDRYSAMSRTVGYDILKYYMTNSPQHGYKRLTRAIKYPIILAMREHAHSLGMRFNVSDAHLRELNDFTNCCGVPPEWNSQVAHFGGAILRAKKNGFVRFSEIYPEVNRLFNGFLWRKAQGFNTGNNRIRCSMAFMTMADWIRFCWNNESSGNSPANMYGCLKRAGVDQSGDIVYSFTGEKK